jgi:dUTP pyrophosphatase
MKVKLLHPDAILPKYAKFGDAGMDITSVEDVCITAGHRRIIKTGLAIELAPGLEAQVRPRSGLAAKHGLTVLNAPGTIDSGYRGEIMVIMLNTGIADYNVSVGDRIAQLVIAKYETVEINEVSELTESNRGEGGLGHTGKN